MSGRYRPLTLCYHAVSAGWRHGLSVDPPTFERHLRIALALGYRPARAEDVVDGRAKSLHVTFDDAYRSVRSALPALERLGVPATVFACTGFVDRGGAALDIPELADHVERFPGELDTMTWDDLRELRDRGVEIGSHTIEHAHLTRLGDDELRRELVESRERLEAELGAPCRFLAYPYGDDDGRVHAAARAAGYAAAFALPGDEQSFDPFALPRVGVYRKDTQLRFALKASPLARRAALAALAPVRKRKGVRDERVAGVEGERA